MAYLRFLQRFILFRNFSAGLLLAALSVAVVHAQQSTASATLSGILTDETGAGLAGAEVVVINVETNLQRRTATDSTGRFRFPLLPVGRYNLKAGQSGFRALMREGLLLTVGQALDINLTLPVADIEASVTVTGEQPVIEAVRTQVAETVTQNEINNIPLNGRNYLDLALLAPGVSRTNTGNNQLFAETSAVPGTGLSIAAQRNLSNNYVLDGVSNNDDAAALTGAFYSQEIIREFQVITSGGIAEFGRSSAGVINVATKSGTNEWHGGIYGFLRNKRFDARNAFASRKSPFTQAQYGATASGPIQSNRTFFFANFEQSTQKKTGFITVSPSNASIINARLNAINFPGARIETGEFPTGFDTANFFLRLDRQLDDRNLFTARYSLYDLDSPNARNIGGLSTVSRGTPIEDRDQTIAASNVTTFSSRLINELRGQYMRSRFAADLNDKIGPAVNISGAANFGIATFSPTGRDIDIYELTDTVSTESGAHSIKFGANFLLNRVDILFPGAVQGVYNFASTANFLAGNYINYTQAFGAESQFQSNPNFGIFVQDQWRARKDLTVNLGLRYDLQFLPDPIETDSNNLSPRIGIAYAPGARKTVIRASYGLYYDRLPLRATSNALQRDGSKYRVAVISFGTPGAPQFPNRLPSFPTASLPPAITRIDPEIEDGYSQQADLQIERELRPTLSVSVGYLYVRSLKIILSRNVNVPTTTNPAVFNLGRPNPNFGNISRFESSGDAYYHGLAISINKRLSRGQQFRISYTLSKAIDNAGNFFFSTPEDNFNLRGDRGLSQNDQRHRLAVSGTSELPIAQNRTDLLRIFSGFKIGYNFTYGTPQPFNIQTGNDRNGDTNVNDRPVGVGRNTGEGFDFASLDLRISRSFRIKERVEMEAIAEAFNLLNRTNLQFPNNTIGANPSMPFRTFGLPTGAADPRQIQFGLRFSF